MRAAAHDYGQPGSNPETVFYRDAPVGITPAARRAWPIACSRSLQFPEELCTPPVARYEG